MLALAVKPVGVNAPVVATEEVGQVVSLGQKAVDLIFGPRLDLIYSVFFR